MKNQKNKGKSSFKGNKDSASGRSRKREDTVIVFDGEERVRYLRGFSERKKERRAYGLAMQKLKDRKAKIGDRKAQKEANLEQVVEAEQQKKKLLKETLGRLEGEEDIIDPAGEITSDDENLQQKIITYKDKRTEEQWGGAVVVTTTTESMFSDDDEDEDVLSSSRKNGGGVDVKQRYAGNVNKYMDELKADMPSKKNKHSARRHKKGGQHGAATMSGIGGSLNLKLAQKALSRAEQTTGRKKKKKKR
mmetsp:Transcript_33395/g.37999  ORF Transcript_33395/g.37999 Transcript_33395/m.37999 type:complete len:248 (-) Transcript_33395:104-847(-)